MNISEEQILALAPDDASRKAGKDLAVPGKWVSKGYSDIALWGACQGSGAKPYQTQIDLVNLAFKCSCPSRKFPCKHGLGLLLLKARKPGEFSKGDTPDWVKEWLNRRTEKDEKKAEKKDKPVDEAAQLKRQQARTQKVNDGINELQLWIKDIIRSGIVTVPEKQNTLFENISRRMIDAQAPGLAAQVKELGNLNYFKEGWQSVFLEKILRLYLLLIGYQNQSSLDPVLQEDLRSLIGFTQIQEELKSKEGIRDKWFVLSKQISEEEQLLVEKNWLYGMNSKQSALILQFYVRSQMPALTLTAGSVYDATLVFFNSTIPLRAIVKESQISQNTVPPEGLKNWKELIGRQTDQTIRLPFLESHPFVMDALKPVLINNQWWLQDTDHHIMPVSRDYPGIWKLLSLSGGEHQPLSLIAHADTYMPLGVWNKNEYKLLI